MKIIVDKEGREILTQMADLSLKTGGLNNLNGVMNVLNSMEDYQDPKKEEKNKKEILIDKEGK